VVHSVQEQAAADGWIGKAGRRRLDVAADGPKDQRPADGAGLDVTFGRQVTGVKAAHMAQHHLDARRLDGCDGPVAISQRQGQGLFAKDLQPRRRTADHIVGVGRGAAGDAHRVQPARVQQRLQVRVDGHIAARPAHLSRPLLVRGRHRHQSSGPDAAHQVLGVGQSHAPRPDDGHSKFVHIPLPRPQAPISSSRTGRPSANDFLAA